MERKIIGLLVISLVILGLVAWQISIRYDYWQLNEVPGESTQISRDDTHETYNAFPKVVRTQDVSVNPNGMILAVWYSGDSHVDSNSDGRILGSFSEDDGSSWKTPTIVYDDIQYDCRNIGILCAPNGTLVIFFAKVDATKENENKELIWVDFGFIKSYDHGNTWSAYVSMQTQLEQSHLGIKSGNGYGDPVIVDGTIYILCYGHAVEGTETTHLTYLFNSTDNGESWKVGNAISPGDDLSTSEADFWYADNLLFGFTRTQNTDKRYLYYFESPDLGKSWGTPQKTNILGDCREIMQLSDGRYLVAIRAYLDSTATYLGYFTLPKDFATHSDKQEYYEKIELKCLVSTTFGQSVGDGSYPSIISLEGNKILVVYYDIGAGGVFSKICSESDL